MCVSRPRRHAARRRRRTSRRIRKPQRLTILFRSSSSSILARLSRRMRKLREVLKLVGLAPPPAAQQTPAPAFLFIEPPIILDRDNHRKLFAYIPSSRFFSETYVDPPSGKNRSRISAA